MALRSVVLSPPPGAGAPRSTVVLRPGGPKDKGKAADLVTLVLGVLLLLACVVLVQLLPNREFALPQYQVTFPEAQINSTSQNFQFTDAESDRIHEFAYELPTNVHSITVVAFFRDDDLPGSQPDQFRVELFDPAGNPSGIRSDLFSSAPLYNDSALPPQYDAGEAVGGRLQFSLGAKPDDQIVQGLSHREVAEQVRARLEPQHRIHSEGVWTVRVTLVNSGNCPEPGAPDTTPQQVVFCRMQPPGNDGDDVGNLFAIENFIYTTYRVEVADLS